MLVDCIWYAKWMRKIVFLKNVYNLERDKRVIIGFVAFVATY